MTHLADEPEDRPLHIIGYSTGQSRITNGHGRSLTPPSPKGRGRIGARFRRDFHGKERFKNNVYALGAFQVPFWGCGRTAWPRCF